MHSLEFNWTFYITAIGSYTLARLSHGHSAWIIYYIIIPFLNLANNSFHWFHKYGKYQTNHFSFYTIILFSSVFTLTHGHSWTTKADKWVVHRGGRVATLFRDGHSVNRNRSVRFLVFYEIRYSGFFFLYCNTGPLRFVCSKG